MGVHSNIGFKSFPEQGNWLFKRVKVCFHYNTDEYLFGTIVREDVVEPGLMIIALDDKRYVLSTECQFQVMT